MIIGIVNTKCAGKATLASALIARGYSYFSISKIIDQEISKSRKKEIDRIKFEMEKRKKNSSFFVKKILEHIEGGKVVIDNISHEDEVKELRKRKHFSLLAVYSPEDLKLERELVKQKYENFQKLSLPASYLHGPEDEHRKHIHECMKLADYSIPFDSGLRNLQDKIERALDEIEKKHDVPV